MAGCSFIPNEALSSAYRNSIILETEHPELQAAEYGDIDAPSQARALVERNLVLPVLDGFDEISQPLHVPAIGRISEALRYSPLGIVISSRYQEFRDAAEAAARRDERRARSRSGAP